MNQSDPDVFGIADPVKRCNNKDSGHLLFVITCGVAGLEDGRGDPKIAAKRLQLSSIITDRLQDPRNETARDVIIGRPGESSGIDQDILEIMDSWLA